MRGSAGGGHGYSGDRRRGEAALQERPPQSGADREIERQGLCRSLLRQARSNAGFPARLIVNRWINPKIAPIDRKTRTCLDCPTAIEPRGGKKRCSRCSRIFAFAQMNERRKCRRKLSSAQS